MKTHTFLPLGLLAVIGCLQAQGQSVAAFFDDFTGANLLIGGPNSANGGFVFQGQSGYSGVETNSKALIISDGSVDSDIGALVSASIGGPFFNAAGATATWSNVALASFTVGGAFYIHMAIVDAAYDAIHAANPGSCLPVDNSMGAKMSFIDLRFQRAGLADAFLYVRASKAGGAGPADLAPGGVDLGAWDPSSGSINVTLFANSTGWNVGISGSMTTNISGSYAGIGFTSNSWSSQGVRVTLAAQSINTTLSVDSIGFVGTLDTYIPSTNSICYLSGTLSPPFGRVEMGESATSQVLFINSGSAPVTAGPLQLSGPGSAAFQALNSVNGFTLPGWGSTAVSVRFAPDAAGALNAVLTAPCGSNSAQVALSGIGLRSKTFTLNLESNNGSGQLVYTRKTLQGWQTAAIVVDMWNSHPDSEMASRTSGLVQRMNLTLDAMRDLGVTVIFSPSDCLADYNGTPQRANMTNYPVCAQTDNGFSPPLPPYYDSADGDMEPPDKSVPAYPVWTHQHPDLVVKNEDLVSLSRQEIYDYCVANGISNLLYLGVAANMCVCYTREFSMVPMRRYCHFQPIFVRDDTDAMTLNDRDPNNYSLANQLMTPDLGHRQVIAADEQYFASVDAAQLMQYWPPASYTCLISTNANLISYWRMDSKASYRENLDVRRIQSSWWYNQTNGLNFCVPGALTQDTNTALGFKGSTTVFISPIYRSDIPANSPFVSLSASNFTLEAWVQLGALNANQWFFSHDNGTSGGVDALLGINASNHFQFVVGGATLVSAAVAAQGDVDSNRWFYLAAVHNRTQATLLLYIDGNLDSQTGFAPHPVSLTSAPHFGSRGVATVDSTGQVHDAGYEFFHGALDEPAVYSAPLAASVIAQHFQVARAIYLTPQWSNHQWLLQWPVYPTAFVLQTATNLACWQDSSLAILQSNGMNQVIIPSGRPAQYFRLRAL